MSAACFVRLRRYGSTRGSPVRQQQDTRAQPQTRCDIPQIESENEPYFGDLPGPVNKRHFRIGGANIGNLPIRRNDPGNEHLFQAVTQYELDCTLLQEVGINWSHLDRYDQWPERTKTYLDPAHTRTVVSHNRQDKNKEPRQWGGTGVDKIYAFMDNTKE